MIVVRGFAIVLGAPDSRILCGRFVGEQAFWEIVEAYETAPTDEHWLRQTINQLPAEE
jgi:hypothetical protein